MKQRISVLLLVFALAACQSKKEAAQQVISKSLQDAELNGFIHVKMGNEVLFHSPISSVKQGLPVPEANTRVQLASLTKLFVEVLVLKLVDEKKLQLDSSIYTYRKSFEPDFGKQISIRHLLKMQSGLPRELNPNDMEAGVRFNDQGLAGSFLDTLPNFELAFEPGSDEAYSNLSYWLLGAIIEDVSGTNIKEAASDYIFNPLQMNASGFRLEERNIGTGYIKTNEKWEQSNFDLKGRFTSGGFYSSVQDLITLITALDKGDFLSRQSRFLLSDSETLKLEIYGSLPGYSNMLIYNEEHEFSLIFLNNIGLNELGAMTDLKRNLENKLGIKYQDKRERKKVSLHPIEQLSDSIPLEKGMKEWIMAVEKGSANKIYTAFAKYSTDKTMTAQDANWQELENKRKELPNFKAAGFRWVRNSPPNGLEVWFVCDSIQKLAIRWIPNAADSNKVENLFIMPDDMEWMGERF